ncbi:hypothetical protein [Streptomyces sp. NPDC097619]|uniref:hypothetical protein n=1 Tax=Streptomyces sp. NPDC097619 TaxID=3157228 RepID=UPI00332CAB38
MTGNSRAEGTMTGGTTAVLVFRPIRSIEVVSYLGLPMAAALGMVALQLPPADRTSAGIAAAVFVVLGSVLLAGLVRPLRLTAGPDGLELRLPCWPKPVRLPWAQVEGVVLTRVRLGLFTHPVLALRLSGRPTGLPRVSGPRWSWRQLARFFGEDPRRPGLVLIGRFDQQECRALLSAARTRKPPVRVTEQRS